MARKLPLTTLQSDDSGAPDERPDDALLALIIVRDQEALALGVEWIYQLHTARAVAHSPSADLKLAQEWAAAYAAAKGPQAALVKQWIEAIEKTDRP